MILWWSSYKCIIFIIIIIIIHYSLMDEGLSNTFLFVIHLPHKFINLFLHSFGNCFITCFANHSSILLHRPQFPFQSLHALFYSLPLVYFSPTYYESLLYFYFFNVQVSHTTHIGFKIILFRELFMCLLWVLDL